MDVLPSCVKGGAPRQAVGPTEWAELLRSHPLQSHVVLKDGLPTPRLNSTLTPRNCISFLHTPISRAAGEGTQ